MNAPKAQTSGGTAGPAGPAHAPAAGKRPRDPRLDFFRGLAMFIILLAHTPGNTWTLWIPARFGFSDATEIFVFCSGMASALAFGAVFASKGFPIATVRIAFRVWQVYWAHIGVFLFTATMLFAIDHYGIGNREIPYIEGPWVVPLFDRTGEALMGLLTLTYVPGLFDILPMYLVILAMIPAVMLAHRVGGTPLVLALMAATWIAANLAGWAYRVRHEEVAGLGAALAAIGARLDWMNLPSVPWAWEDATWFFNPFAWQIVFFTGFCFGMGWLPAPPVNRWLIRAAAAVVLLTIPLAWYKIYGWKVGYLPEDWGGGVFWDLREAIGPVYWKTWQGIGRFVHFLSLAYLAWVAVGPRGVRLSEGFRAPGAPGRIALGVAAAVCLAFWPHVLAQEIREGLPSLEAWLLQIDWLGLTHVTEEGERLLAHPNRIGLYQLLFGVAALVLLWAALPAATRQWLTGEAFTAAVPVIRKVGTQSLAVFMVSIPLARAMGWALDHVGRDVWSRAGVNLAGFAILIGVAYLVAWIKRQPWRDAARPVASRPGADRPAVAGTNLPAQH